MMRTRAVVALMALLTTLAPFARASAAQGCEGVAASRFYEMIQAPQWAAGGGAITAYAVDPRNPERLLATNGASVMETTDGGCSWEQTFAVGLLPSLEVPVSSLNATVEHIAIPQRNSNLTYLVVEEKAGPISRPHVIVSRDRGKTWAASDEGLPPLSGEAVTIEPAPSDPDVAYLVVRELATGTDSVYATNDAGATWEQRATGEGASAGMAIDPLDVTNVWFYGAGGLYHSVDGGRTRALQNRLSPPIPFFDVHHVPGKPARLMAYQGETQDFMRSDDGGATWYPEGTPQGSAISLTHAPATGQMAMSVHNAVFRFEEPSFWIEITPAGIEEIDLQDLQADATSDPSVFGNAGTYIARYTGLGFEVKLPDVEVDPLPPIDTTGANLTPPKTRLEMRPGSTRKVPYELTLPEHPTGLDVFFLVDVSDSMNPTIAGLRHGMNEIVEELGRSKIDVQFGLGSYKDYPIPGYGSPVAGDYPYRLDRAIGPPDAEFTAALETLTSSGGGDLPESQLTGVYQAATGAGEPGFVDPGRGAGFRSDALQVIVHMTDAAFNNSPAHPSPSMDVVAAELENKGIYHIGLAVWGKHGNFNAVRDLTSLSDASESNAPTPVDCNGDGTVDIVAGAPLVCDIREEARAGVLNLAPAIVATVKAVSREVPVELEATGGGRILGSVTPEVYPRIDVIRSASLGFDVTFNCPKLRKKTTEQVTLQAKVLEVPVASAEVDVVCKAAPAAALAPKPKEEKPPPPIVPPPPAPAPAVVLVPPAPPAPIPEPIPGTQPNAQAQGAMADQEQEQTQLAFVHAAAWKAELEEAVAEELALSDQSQRPRRGVPPAAVYATASLMALAYAFMSVSRTRTQAALQRVRRY
ncbi:MAG TPA: hypothetical protein VEV43_05770 [Actinomycetota bacterium]|nr:hypothetical protein [Actinomycetota bacterium]